jgi:prepilin signal peptidase PulO-like enzyme (type II secretory pathway)
MMIVILAVLGLCIGSFVCASVWRLHEQSLQEAKKKPTKADKTYARRLSISKGRSMCDSCKHELAAKDLVPLLSWLWLRGKCRYCRHPIGFLEPLMELATALVFVVSYLAWPVALQGQGLFDFIAWLVLVSGFMGLALYDLKWFLLPDKIILPLTVVAALQVLIDSVVFGDGLDSLALAVTGGVLIAGLFYGLFAVSKGNWIGGGDVKLAFTLGLLAGGPLQAVFIIFFSSVLGTLAAVPLLLGGKAVRSSHIPYGPFLLAATAIVVLWGESLLELYKSIFIPY